MDFSFAESKRKYLNVGCGPKLLHGFVNLDYLWVPGIDYAGKCALRYVNNVQSYFCFVRILWTYIEETKYQISQQSC